MCIYASIPYYLYNICGLIGLMFTLCGIFLACPRMISDLRLGRRLLSKTKAKDLSLKIQIPFETLALSTGESPYQPACSSIFEVVSHRE